MKKEIKKNIYKYLTLSVFAFASLFFISISVNAGSCLNGATSTGGIPSFNSACVSRTNKTDCESTSWFYNYTVTQCIWEGEDTNPNSGLTVSVSASPNVITPGATSRIIFSSTGATYCQYPGNLSAGTSGYFDVNPVVDTPYSVNCWSSNGQFALGSTTVYMQNSTNQPLWSISEITTKSAKNIEDTKATLWGSMIPGTDIKAYFRYSPVSPESITPIFCNDIYGSKMRATNEVLISGYTLKDIYTTVDNLSPNTTYFYCIVGSGPYEGQIDYGGVESFTTKIAGYDPNNPGGESSEEISITTNNALVVNKNSAYLNGFFNTNTLAETWFEYRKTDYQTTPGNQSISFGKKVLNFFSINKAKAQFQNGWSDPVGKTNHAVGTNGNISFLLNGLSPGTNYEYRAVIKAKPRSGSIGPRPYSLLKYGAKKTFTTENNSGSGPGTPGGVGYEDPCLGSANDPNCNGTGGGIIRDRIGISIGGLPDLIVGPTSVSSTIINTPVTFSSMVKNQGRNPTSFINIIENTAPEGGNISFLRNFFKAKIAEAKNKLAANTVEIGSFYGFFQMSTINPNQKNNSSIINFPYIFISPLGAGNSKTISQNHIFTSSGTYYVRACADKKSPADMGLIREIYENNNCGPWKEIHIGLYNIENNEYENDYNYDDNNENENNINYNNLTLGQTATPPVDAIVRYHEGIEHVFVRQIMANMELAQAYGYQPGGDLQTFAWDLADILARTFGYVGDNGREIRVSQPDIAAYQLYMRDRILTVYEYYDSVIVNIQRMMGVVRDRYEYEYYYNKN